MLFSEKFFCYLEKNNLASYLIWYVKLIYTLNGKEGIYGRFFWCCVEWRLRQ